MSNNNTLDLDQQMLQMEYAQLSLRDSPDQFARSGGSLERIRSPTNFRKSNELYRMHSPVGFPGSAEEETPETQETVSVRPARGNNDSTDTSTFPIPWRPKPKAQRKVTKRSVVQPRVRNQHIRLPSGSTLPGARPPSFFSYISASSISATWYSSLRRIQVIVQWGRDC